jgi:hypothetical protein
MNSKIWLNIAQRIRPHEPLQRLHQFSDSALHSWLLVALLAIAALTVYQGINTAVAVWLLEPVVVQGQSVPPAR